MDKNKLTPEERAEAVLQLIESDFGQSGRDVRFLAIRDELVAAINETKEEDAKLCESNHIISGGLGPAFNAGWSEANKSDANAIRASKIKE